MGKSLMGRHVGDEMTVQRPRGEVTCKIVEVRSTP